MPGIYLKLSNGSRSTLFLGHRVDGPLLGPFSQISSHYGSSLKVVPVASKESDPIPGELIMWSDMLYYDGYYYEDWSIHTEETVHECKNSIDRFAPEKASHGRRKSGKTRPPTDVAPSWFRGEAGKPEVGPSGSPDHRPGHGRDHV